MNAAAVSGGDPDRFDGIGNGSRRSAVQHTAVNKTLMLFGTPFTSVAWVFSGWFDRTSSNPCLAADTEGTDGFRPDASGGMVVACVLVEVEGVADGSRQGRFLIGEQEPDLAAQRFDRDRDDVVHADH